MPFCLLLSVCLSLLGLSALPDGVHGEHGEALSGEYITGDKFLYLNENLTSQISVNGDITICLNGKTISNQITVEGGTLTLCDCTGQGEIRVQTNAVSYTLINVWSNATLNAYGVPITLNQNSEAYHAIYANPNSTVNLYSSPVSGNIGGSVQTYTLTEPEEEQSTSHAEGTSESTVCTTLATEQIINDTDTSVAEDTDRATEAVTSDTSGSPQSQDFIHSDVPSPTNISKPALITAVSLLCAAAAVTALIFIRAKHKK